MYFYKGNVQLDFHDKSFFVKTGDIVFLPKGIENKNYRIISQNRFGLYNVYFDTADSLPKEAIRIPLQNQKLGSAYETMHRLWATKSQGYYFRVMQLFYEVLLSVMKQQNNYSKHKNNDFFVTLEEYMMQHFCDKNFNYEKLAKISSLSYSYFKKVFISRYGMPPVKYITELRIRYACELLKTGKYKISEIAQMCGYENVYYFSNVFKKQKGVSPKNYI